MPKFQVGDTLVNPNHTYTAEVLRVGKKFYRLRWSDQKQISEPKIHWIDNETNWTKKEEDTTMKNVVTSSYKPSSKTMEIGPIDDRGTQYLHIKDTSEQKYLGIELNRAELLAALNAVDAPVLPKPLPSGIGAVIRSKLSKDIFVRADFNLWAGGDGEGNLSDSAFSTSKKNWDEFYEVLSDGVEL